MINEYKVSAYMDILNTCPKSMVQSHIMKKSYGIVYEIQTIPRHNQITHEYTPLRIPV